MLIISKDNFCRQQLMRVVFELFLSFKDEPCGRKLLSGVNSFRFMARFLWNVFLLKNAINKIVFTFIKMRLAANGIYFQFVNVEILITSKMIKNKFIIEINNVETRRF